MSEFTSTDQVYRVATTPSTAPTDPLSDSPYLTVTPRRVFASFNPIGIFATVLAAFITLIAAAGFLNLVLHQQLGFYRQIYDPNFCGLVTIAEPPKRLAGVSSTTAGSDIRPVLNLLTTPSDTNEAIGVTDASSGIVPAEAPAMTPDVVSLDGVEFVSEGTLRCRLDSLTLSAFISEFEFEPRAYSSCWQKVPLTSGNFYIFLTKPVCEAMLAGLGEDDLFEFYLNVAPNPRIATARVQAERNFLHDLTSGDPYRTDSTVLKLEITCLFIAAFAIFLWKKCVYDSVHRDLYLSCLYASDPY